MVFEIVITYHIVRTGIISIGFEVYQIAIVSYFRNFPIFSAFFRVRYIVRIVFTKLWTLPREARALLAFLWCTYDIVMTTSRMTGWPQGCLGLYRFATEKNCKCEARSAKCEARSAERGVNAKCGMRSAKCGVRSECEVRNAEREIRKGNRRGWRPRHPVKA